MGQFCHPARPLAQLSERAAKVGPASTRSTKAKLGGDLKEAVRKTQVNRGKTSQKQVRKNSKKLRRNFPIRRA
jgi:hypothetical protein